jgi:hypothetical protein
MKYPPINQPKTFNWNGRDCIVVNPNLEDVYLCMEVGKTSGIFSVLKSEVDNNPEADEKEQEVS